MINRRKILFLLLPLCLLIFSALLYWGIGPTLACAFPSSRVPGPGHSAHTIESDGGQRCYLLSLPTAFDPQRPLPLILSLHGFSSNPHGQRSFSQWDPVAEEAYAAVVYPQGTGFPQRWNANPAFSKGGADDVQFMRDLIDHLMTQLPINQDQVFLTGFSNGAAMTLRLACEISSQIAAIGTVAAPVSPALSDCQPERALPLIAFHGTLDPIVPYAGREGEDWESLPLGQEHIPTSTLYPASTWIEHWASKNGCRLETSSLPGSEEIKGLQFDDCQGGAEVIFYTVVGGGHTWPGGRPIPFVGKTTRELNASEQMWAFFSRHPLP
jgi:polyhydroxybutyrate depolymerase